MSDSLLNPIQAEEVVICVDTLPKQYFPNNIVCQSLHFSSGTIIPVLYEGVLPYIPIRRPTKEEAHHCQRLEMSSRIPCYLFLINGDFFVYSGFVSVHIIEVVDHINAHDTVASDIMYTQLRNLISIQSVITHVDGSDEF